MYQFQQVTPICFDLKALSAAVAEIAADPSATKTAKNNSSKLAERINASSDLFSSNSLGLRGLGFFYDKMTGTAKGNTARVYYSPSYTQAPRKVRKAIVPTNPTNKFIYFDITAAEFVMNSYLIGDSRVIEANRRGEDVYMAYKDIFPEGTPRDFIKGSLIATMYGATYKTISGFVGCDEKTAKSTLKAIEAAIPLRKTFADCVKELSLKTGSYWAGRGFSFNSPEKISEFSDAEPFNLRRALSIATQSALGLWMQGLLRILQTYVGKDTTLIQVFDSVVFEVPKNAELKHIRTVILDMVAPFNVKMGEGFNFYEAQISAK